MRPVRKGLAVGKRMRAGNERSPDDERGWLATLGSRLCMNCRVHATHKSSGFQFLCDYSDWSVALHDIPRLEQAGFTGVPNGSAPATREPGARQREAQLLDVLQHLQVQCEQAAAREGRLMQLLEAMQRQQQLCVEREAHLLHLLEQAQAPPPRGLDAPPPPAPVVAPDHPAAIAASAPMPARWYEVLRYFESHPEPQSPAAVGLALGWKSGVVGGLLRRMKQHGLLSQGPALGSYELPMPEQKEE